MLGPVTGIDPITGLPYSPGQLGWAVTATALADVAAYTNSVNLFLQGGAQNLFGLTFQTALVSQGPPPVILSPNGSVAMTNADVFFSQTVDPTLQLSGYYFAPVNSPGTALASDVANQNQIYPLPPLLGFTTTNQTGIIAASVGTPTTIGGWAKFGIQNGSANKFAYLGQYFVTNAFVLTNGMVTTNTTGVVSPYGDFFPTQPGVAAMVTMPDINTGAQGTGIVRVISLNVDANHDGTMDFTYQGPDFVSSGKPFRFWVNDNTDEGDFGGNFGIPGQGAQGDGVVQIQTPVAVLYQTFPITYANGWEVHGRRDLVDFFPVYLNIGSLFQSNALSAGINATDTNYQFILSQDDSALRFAYTDLSPTNYMKFLQDTIESSNLASAFLTTITNTANGGTKLPQAFISAIATNNQGIILVEALETTSQPLVLSVYHGTNQIAQTSLALSITSIEQMFRHKNLLLSASPAKPDRLTDADVPNEPDTIDRNFVFLHGYNVLPNEARGVAADMFKRMYWSGSHAKFWAVTWQGADTKGSFPFYNKLTPNYHTNVYNAFLTAPLLANFIANITSSGPVVASAHSLGNMVTLSAISDWNAPISQYFMLDAAVPIEAIDSTAATNFMVYSTGLNNWPPYTNRLYASYWHQLFPTSDARSALSWNNRLGNLGNVDVYNIYSSGEEVLRTQLSDPPSSVLGKVLTQATDFWPGRTPFGTYTWYWQEKGKGTCSQDWFLGSSHGGWKMNYYPPYLYVSNGLPAFTSPAQALGIPPSQLMTNAFFDLTSSNWGTADLALYGASGSSYAQANRNRILSDAIPAMSQVAGANSITALNQPGQTHNFDMMTLENGWSSGRLTSGEQNNDWYHSDFHQMAYTFTYRLFNQFVTTGDLK